MNKKIYFFLCALLVSMSAMAAWDKPALPASTPLSVGDEVYLFNTGAEAFYLGANDWSTRASYNTTRGYKVYVQKKEVGGTWDNASYLITCYIEEGDPAGQTRSLFIAGTDALWVDQAEGSADDNGFTFVAQGDGSYRIGLSEKNTTYSESQGFEGYYLGVNPSKNDTRLYLIDSNEVTDAQLNWIFVKPDVYATYVTARKVYEAATALGATIAEAESISGVDAATLAAAKSAYGNNAFTAEELTAQNTALKAAVRQARIDNATVDNPAELLVGSGIATDFNDGEATGWTSTTTAQNKQASNGNNAADFSVTGNHYENWNGSPFEPGKIRATVTDLPTGVFRLEALAFANVTGQTYLYAGEGATLVESTNIDINQKTTVLGFTSSGSLEIGLDVRAKGPNWVGLDNVYLYYLGDTEEAYKLLVDQLMADEPDFGDFYQHSVYDTYTAAKEALQASKNAEDFTTAYPAYMSALRALNESVAAYQAFSNKVEEMLEWVDQYQDMISGEEMELLLDYLQADQDFGPEESDAYKNGSANYVLYHGLLTPAQLEEEAKFMVQLRDNALANGMKDGDDVTSIIKNPHFSEEGQWTKEGLPEWPMGTDDYKLAQAYSIKFDVYQQFTGLQPGLYELSFNALYRPANPGTGDYTDDHRTGYAYMNTDEVALNPIEAFKTDTLAYSDDALLTDESGYVPNTVQGAATAFAQGRYQQSLYGIVTDGTMKVGFRNNVRYEGCWAVFSDVKLIFRAKNPEVLAKVVEASIPNAVPLLDNKCGQSELSDLSSAIAAAQTAEGEGLYDALVDLKNAQAAVLEGTDLYNSLNLALSNLEEAIQNYASSSKIEDAKKLYNEANAAYEAGSLYNEAAAAKAEEVASMVVTLKLGDNVGGQEQDVTNLIVNPNFDPTKGDKAETRIDGWVTTALNGYKEYTASYNRSGFHLYQDLSGLPAGKYKVKVHTYYRAGYWNEEEQYIAAGQDVHHTTFYAETSEENFNKPCMLLTEGATEEIYYEGKAYTLSNGLHAPDGTSASAAWFKNGAYLNELEFTVPEDGKVRIGLKKDETLPNDYQVVGAWELYYYPEEERVDVTDLIVNPFLDPEKGSKNETRIDGWVTTAMNGYKEWTASYNRSGFHLYQDLVGLPAGNYEVTVHTYYRAGYWNEEEQYIAAGQDVHHTEFYAETSDGKESKPCLLLTEGATEENYFEGKAYTLSSGLYAPDGTSATAAWFKNGAYLNTLRFTVPADGKARIGLKKDETLPNDYQVVGAWHLYYLGGGTATKKGDVNEDGKVDINDVVAIINQMAGTASWKNANVNEDPDGAVDINDVVAVINIMAAQ